jgi:UDP-N-acetylglucosamine 2-epimerase
MIARIPIAHLHGGESTEGAFDEAIRHSITKMSHLHFTATEEYKKQLEDYVSKLEIEGHKVHLPHRDTNQQGSGIDICKQNRKAIELSDEVHLFYSAESQGTHFDMGVAFALRKTIKVI